MFALTPENYAELQKLNATYGVRHRGDAIIADIHCLMTKKVYASAEGGTELLAVQAAIEVAKTADKPYQSSGEATAAMSKEIADLKKQLAEATNTSGTGAMPPSPDDSDREELMRQLDEAGVEYRSRSHTKTLANLLEEHKLEAASA